MQYNLKEFDKEQQRFIQFGIEKKLDERLMKFLANKSFPANKMWALYFAIQNKISAYNIKVLASSHFESTQIYKIIDAINDKIIDQDFLKNYDFHLPFNIQFSIYKKNDVLSDDWKKFIIALFPKDINLCELDFLISFIDDSMDLNVIKKHIKKPKDINYFVNLFSIVRSNIQDELFLKLILRENPNYNKTAAIIDLKEYVDNDIIKNKLLKLNVKQLYVILDLFNEKKSQIIIDYLFDYKCKISNIDEIDIVKNILENLEESKGIAKNELLKILFDKKFITQKIYYLTEIHKKYKKTDIVKVASILNLSSFEEYDKCISKMKDNKLDFSQIWKYFRPNFKMKNINEQIDNIIAKKSEEKLFDYMEKIKTKS